MSYQENRDFFVWHMAKNGVYLPDIRIAMKLATTICRINVEGCNRQITDKEKRRRSTALRKLVNGLDPYKIKVKQEGLSIYLILPKTDNHGLSIAGGLYVPVREVR